MGKRCSTCKKYKEYSEFYKRTASSDGCSFVCKSCNQEYAKEFYKKNKAVIDEKSRKYRIGYRDIRRQKAKERREARFLFEKDGKVKICDLCGEEKAFLDFYIENYSKDGRRNQCKSCMQENARKNAREVYARRKEREKEQAEELIEKQAAEWEKKSPGYSKRYYINNIKKINKLIKKKNR